jgi:hypothetical protein
MAGLTPTQKAQVEAGQLLYIPEKVGRMPWPRAVVYRYLPATPLEVMAVFTSYESADDYIPNLVEAKILRTIRPGEQEVRYTLRVPLLPNEVYTAINTLTSQQGGRRLRVAWKAGEARYFQSSIGQLEVEAHGQGSIIRYTNLVDPGSRFAGVLKGTAEKQIKETVNAIAERVIFLKTQEPRKLAQKVQTLERTLRQLPPG